MWPYTTATLYTPATACDGLPSLSGMHLHVSFTLTERFSSESQVFCPAHNHCVRGNSVIIHFQIHWSSSVYGVIFVPFNTSIITMLFFLSEQSFSFCFSERVQRSGFLCGSSSSSESFLLIVLKWLRADPHTTRSTSLSVFCLSLLPSHLAAHKEAVERDHKAAEERKSPQTTHTHTLKYLCNNLKWSATYLSWK